MKISEILAHKGSRILSTSPEETVFNAIKLMSEYNVGALLVMEGSELKGIISERDYRDKVILKGRTSMETKVQEIMTSQVVCVSPSHSVQGCLSIMTDKKIRHLPVLDDSKKVVGVISIGDLVKAVISEQEHEIEDLKSYITGGYMS